MLYRPARRTSDTLSQDDLRAALERILLSQLFASSPRSSQFLQYVVNQSLAGRGSDLNEFAIGLDVFGRTSSFDPRTDTIVRVQARRLRKRLADYYANEGSSEPIAIELPKGSYAPEFRLSNQNQPTGRQAFFAAIVDRRRSALWIGVAGGLIAFIALVPKWPEFPTGVLASSWLESAPDQEDSQSESPISVPLTAFGGHEREPDLSPDGESVAFLWDGELQNNP